LVVVLFVVVVESLFGGVEFFVFGDGVEEDAVDEEVGLGGTGKEEGMRDLLVDDDNYPGCHGIVEEVNANVVHPSVIRMINSFMNGHSFSGPCNSSPLYYSNC
jgi:hypothetical protein